MLWFSFWCEKRKEVKDTQSGIYQMNKYVGRCKEISRENVSLMILETMSLEL